MNLSQRLCRFAEPALKNPISLIKGFLVAAVYTGFTIFNVYLVKIITSAIETSNQELFWRYFGLGIIIYIIYFLLSTLWRHWGWASNIYVYQKYLHNKYIPKFIRLDNNSTETLGTGKIISIMDGGIDDWHTILVGATQVVTELVLTMVFSIYMIWLIGSSYVMYFLLLFILVHIFEIYLNKFVLKIRAERTDLENEYSRQLVKIIMSKFEVLQNNKISHETAILDKYNSDTKKVNLRLNNFLFSMYSVPSLVLTILRVGTFAILGYGIFRGDYKMSDFVAIIALFGYIESVLRVSVDFFKNATNSFGKIDKLWSLFDDTAQIKGYETGNDFDFKKGDISIQNITFSYGDKEIFKDFTLNIEGNQKTALVGVSGSGKSTLVKLISGYVRPNLGTIFVDGQDLSQTKLKSYYPSIGYLTQDPGVFDGSVIENLVYGISQEISQEKIDEIIRLAKCEFIYEFKDGLQTQIGERGVRLSGGQKQRLAIAKLMLKNPGIVILDEPTSALDSFSEEQITKALNNLFENKTVIIIAHRLQTVKNADNIIVLEKGTIMETGTHEDLVNQNGYYKKMLDLQSGFLG